MPNPDVFTLQPRYVYWNRWRRRDGGSNRLFEACWREFRHAGFDARSDADVDDALEAIAAAKVNNPKSGFYIYGR